MSFRVSAVYLTWANALFLAVLALSEINKLRVISEGQNSDSPASTNPLGKQFSRTYQWPRSAHSIAESGRGASFHFCRFFFPIL